MKSLGMKVSVIVPLFNSEKSLDESINSVLNQTYRNIEIILINDGSTDSTREKLEHYKKLDSRIIVINQLNSGTNVSRKNGLIRASGKAIFHLDSDDILELYAIEVLVKKMEETKANLVLGYHWKHTGNKKTLVKNYLPANQNKITLSRQLLMGRITGYIWGRLISKDLLENLNIPSHRRYSEDMLTNLSLICKNNIQAEIVKLPLVHYRIHGGNISYSNNPAVAEHTFQVAEDIEKLLRESQIFSQVRESFYAFKCRNWVVYCRRGGIKSFDKDFRKFFKKDYFDFWYSKIPVYQKVEMICYTQHPVLGKHVTSIMRWIEKIL